MTCSWHFLDEHTGSMTRTNFHDLCLRPLYISILQRLSGIPSSCFASLAESPILECSFVDDTIRILIASDWLADVG